MALSSLASAQNLEQIGKAPWLTVNGGISANGVYYDGTANREPFTYFLTGNLNFAIAGVYNIPLSFSYTNQDFAYQTPFKINRLSIHPSYKWVATHIGDVSMSFSPYTVNGHQFTGFGFDLTPKKPYAISALYGRFLRPIEYNEEIPEQLPAFERYGYGFKTSYDFRKVLLGLTFFKAIDDNTSIKIPIPENLGIQPKENLVVSLESDVKLVKNLNFHVEYAQSAVTENVLDDKVGRSSSPLSFLIDERESTNYYSAINTNLTYSYGNGSFAVAYERVDPEYRTFGAYFFNNDLENITVKANQKLFNKRVSFTFNGGLQRDDIKKKKESQSNRVVLSMQAVMRATSRLNINASYSNFQTYTNIKNRFDAVNELDELANRDTLNFRQVSQNASSQFVYALTRTKRTRQQLGLNLNYQNSKDIQGNTNSNPGSNFYNGVASHTLGYPKRSLKITTSLTGALNKSINSESLIYGPTLGVAKLYFNKKLRTGLSSSYNITTINNQKQGNIYNIRANAGYVYKERHQFDLRALALFRNSTGSLSKNDLTITFGYRYSFDVKKPELNFVRNPKIKQDSIKTLKNKSKGSKYFRFRYRDIIYEGSAPDIVTQVNTTSNEVYFKDASSFDKDSLRTALDRLELSAFENKDFKNNAITYLEDLYLHKDFIDEYNRLLLMALQRIKRDVDEKSYVLMNALGEAEFKMEHHILHDHKNPKEFSEEQQQEYTEFVAEFKDYSNNTDIHFRLKNWVDAMANRKSIQRSEGDIRQLRDITMLPAFYRKIKGETSQQIVSYLLDELIMFYDRNYRQKD